ncbi:MAG: DNA recombination/repair protein RecA, partial [Candidatus Latescibacteria bacterium]|nr:DNA recombination/repair protein RecA [Candidatus Latescibacterota bacterium]
QKSGTWFSYGDERLGQGRENVKRYMKENPKMAVQLEREVREAVGLPVDDVVEVKEVAVDAKEVALEGEKA